MRGCLLCALSLLLAVASVPSVQAAEGQAQDATSLLIWLIFLLPTFLVFIFIYRALRAGQKQQELVQTEVQRCEDERQRTAAHREELLAQMAGLDEKLTRMIELLTAIERGQRKSDL
jgi:hypothetical protein